MKRVRVFFARSLLFLALVLLTFVVVEGLSSTVVFGSRLLKSGRQSQRYYLAGADERHSQHDSTLGWVGMPDRHIPDLYGDGKYLRTDSHGFRSDEEVLAAVPEGRARAICTGDSFAFGQGVANDKTWCHLLSVIEPRLQTVNMGQRGYGVDQAYLWYRRDGLALEHQVLLFSFIGGDFGRMRNKAHHGYGKPILRLRNGELEVGNTPVPGYRGRDPWKSRLRVAAAQLRSVELGRRLLDRSPMAGKLTLSRSTEAVAERLIEELARSCRDRNVELVLIWLPVKREIDSQEVKWRVWVQNRANLQNLAFIDLSTPMRELPRRQARSFFITEEDTENFEAAGHYNELGHAWVAAELHARLLEIETVQSALPSRNGS